MNKSVLVVTGSHDLTCDYVIEKHPAVSFYRFDIDHFSQYNVSFSDYGFLIENDTGQISTDTCQSIYYRKPRLEDLSEAFNAKYHDFAHAECYAIVEGIVESFAGRCLSRPSILRKANNKILQLSVAKTAGFRMPKSLITNSPSAKAKFFDGQTIIKPLASGTIDVEGQKEYVQTNLVDESIDDSLLKYAPAYFQGYIEKDYELRLTFVGMDVYSVRIDSENKIDWRKRGNNVSYSAEAVPQDIYEKCLKFMKNLDMEFGCFDFLVKDGEYIFLEMNANGQWAWLEFETGLEISSSIVKFLTRK
ncbi:MvdC/MvdD family ATP grasp protein [Paraburkholderia sediminicola]|uniref:MvdC/MvdD family ATP grasp protein n=1 Tax=Paraburkholderia sediminicola TaxID=458836 RepID=UPI0038B7F9EE